LRYSTIGKDGKHGWGTYPRLSMSGNFTQGRLQHEECFVSTIDIRGQDFPYKLPKLSNTSILTPNLKGINLKNGASHQPLFLPRSGLVLQMLINKIKLHILCDLQALNFGSFLCYSSHRETGQRE
jgi:hypothetical protein